MQDVAPLPPPPAPQAVAQHDPYGYLDVRGGTRTSRLVWASTFLIPLAVLLTAAWLHPSPLHHGTHTQLGLPPCGFLVMTGVPCPGCGLTTAFANMIRGNVVAAAQANPFGILLFLVTLFSMPVSLLGAIKGWRVVPVLERVHADRWALVLAAVSVTVWVTKVVTILATR
jgi:hypothetical protein